MNNNEEIEVVTELDWGSPDYNYEVDYKKDPSLRAPVVLTARARFYSAINANELAKDIEEAKAAMAKAGANPNYVIADLRAGVYTFRMIETEEMTRKRFAQQEKRDLEERQEQIEQARCRIEDAQALLKKLGACQELTNE